MTEVVVEGAGASLPGTLTVPAGSGAVVVFAHGSGSSRSSPRNVAVADALNRRGLGTLLFDLLTPMEAGDRGNVFDIPLLGRRLLGAAMWLRGSPSTSELAVGYFGASTGGGAALWAAAEPGGVEPFAVVSRGGRPDLAGARLGDVRSPTLLIVGGNDPVVHELNEEAGRALRCERRVEVIAGATHLFEEPGALEEVARLAGEWFAGHIPA